MAKRINKNILSIFICLFAISSSVFSSNNASAEDKTETLVTTGVAMAGQTDSRRNAIEDAMRNAVEEAMGTIVNVELLVENKAIVNEKILSQTKGYIQNYKVNSEEEKGGLYRVQIEATVKLGKVKGDMEVAGLLLPVAAMADNATVGVNAAQPLLEKFWKGFINWQSGEYIANVSAPVPAESRGKAVNQAMG